MRFRHSSIAFLGDDKSAINFIVILGNQERNNKVTELIIIADAYALFFIIALAALVITAIVER